MSKHPCTYFTFALHLAVTMFLFVCFVFAWSVHFFFWEKKHPLADIKRLDTWASCIKKREREWLRTIFCMSENSLPYVCRAALKRLFSASVQKSLPIETKRRATGREAKRNNESKYQQVMGPALQPSNTSLSSQTCNALQLRRGWASGQLRLFALARRTKRCPATQARSKMLQLNVRCPKSTLELIPEGSVQRSRSKSEVYLSNGSLLSAKAVRTAASPVWPAQERRAEKRENRQTAEVSRIFKWILEKKGSMTENV